jgi:hypothetical protein
MCVPAVESISCPGARGVRTVQQENMAWPAAKNTECQRDRSHGNHKQPRTYRPSIRPRWHAGRPDPTGLFLVDMTPRELRFPAHFFWLPSGYSIRVDRDGNLPLAPAKEAAAEAGRNVREGMRLSERRPQQCNEASNYAASARTHHVRAPSRSTN